MLIEFCAMQGQTLKFVVNISAEAEVLNMLMSRVIKHLMQALKLEEEPAFELLDEWVDSSVPEWLDIVLKMTLTSGLSSHAHNSSPEVPDLLENLKAPLEEGEISLILESSMIRIIYL